MSFPNSTLAATEQDPRWAAVVARDPGADDRFVYSVATTGVYCRPSCAARRPLPENVRFHASSADAERAGFRACKRCRPDQPSWRQQHRVKVTAACRRIESAEQIPSLSTLATAAGMSPYHFHRVFKAATGVTPKAYADACRADRLRGGLSAGSAVTDAIYDAGYNSSGRFYEKSATMLGMKASSWRAGGRDQRIVFAVADCRLGAILVAESARGICSILLGDDPQRLIDDLHARFPRAELVAGDAAFDERVAIVIGFVEAPGVGLDLPLDLRGTAFQQRVWQALRAIPPGSTATYSDIATAIGHPKAARAVGAACGANPIAVAVPCHRIVRRGGDLSGYRWGIERKRLLLDLESSGEVAPSIQQAQRAEQES